MNQARGKILLTVFLLVAPEAVGPICCAKPQQKQAGESPQPERNGYGIELGCGF